MRHGADKDDDRVRVGDGRKVLGEADGGGIKGEGNFVGEGGEVVRDGVLDHLEQLFRAVDGADREAMEELDHEAAEALERAGDADGRIDLNEDAARGVDIHLQLAGLVQGRVEEREEALQALVKTEEREA